jgi:hypothetical protein
MIARDPHLCVKFADSESILQLQRAYYPRSRDTTPALSQDGIVVPEVPPPSVEEPIQQILRWRGLRVDLREADRVKLDLSRNLTQESSISLWDRLVPRIWNGIVANGLSYQECRDALGDLLCSVNALSRGRETLVLTGRKNLQVWDLRRSVRAKTVVMATLGDLSWRDLESEDDSGFVVLLPDMDRLNDPMLVFGDTISPPRPISEEGTETPSADDALLESFSQEVLEAEIPKTSPFRQEHILDFWARIFSENLFPSLKVSRILTRMIEKFGFVLPTAQGYAVFNSSRGEWLTDIGAFRLNPEWIAIRDPRDAKWHFLKTADVDSICDRDLSHELSWAQYVFFVMTQIWPPSQKPWKNCWPNGLKLRQKGRTAARLLAESKESLRKKHLLDDRAYERFLEEEGYSLEDNKVEHVANRVYLNEVFLDEVWEEVKTDDLNSCLLPDDATFWGRVSKS